MGVQSWKKITGYVPVEIIGRLSALRGACLGLDTEIVSCPCLFGVTQGVQSSTFGADLTAETAVGKAE